MPAFVNWPARLKPRTVNEPLHMVDVMPTLLALAGGTGSADHPFDGRDMWKTIADGAPGPTDDVLINVELFAGAVRKGDWKLIKIALLPGKTELFNLAKDPGETTNVAAENPDVARDLEARLLKYAKEQKPSLWIKASRPSSEPRARRSWTRISTSTTAACRMKNSCFRMIIRGAGAGADQAGN